MKYLKINGNQQLTGSIKVSGAKNAALPLIASTILAKNKINITNIPEVVDIKTLLLLLGKLGAEYQLKNNILLIDTINLNKTKATYDIVKTMRASILTLGPLLARFGNCQVSLPGGCAIGQRPIDLHLKALKQMGADIDIKNGYISASSKHILKGSVIVFDKVTVTGTENIVMASVLAKGKTKLINIAQEPEVIQLCEVLKNSGVDIKGIGTDELEIYGTAGELIEFKDFKVIPDRIEAGTYLCAGAITNSELTVTDVIPQHLEAVLSKFEEMGFSIIKDENNITIKPTNQINPIKITTSEYPAFPTDMQAQFMALATQANGTSIIEEKLFENRFMHSSELQRLGANINIKSNTAIIEGKSKLFGADVMATDLRASSALVLAGLIATGETNVHRIYHLDRGYENLENKLNFVGAKIKRIN